jgi:chemotaxis family two-component system sensor kinase Cph1
MTTASPLAHVFLTATADAAFVMDPDRGRIVEANDAGCRLLGYSRAELLATPISAIHPAELEELSALLQQVLDFQRASTIKLTCRTRQGVFLPTEIALHAVALDGRLGIVGLVQDRSEHRACCPGD